VQRITTPTRWVDKFGVGKSGFADSVPGPPTQLEAVWFDNMQEEVSTVIEDQGYALDGLTLNQLSFALNNYAYSGAVAYTNGATLNMLSGSVFLADAGSTFQVDTSTASFNGDLLIGDSSADALIVTSSSIFQSPVSFNGDVDIGNSILDTLTITSKIDAKVTITATDAAAFLLNVTNLGAGGGVQSLVVGGYAGYFQTDTTSPTRAALFIMPQDSDPSSPTPGGGDIYHHSTRCKVRTYTFNGWESFHSSNNGYVFAFGTGIDQAGLVGTTGNIANTVISPETTGNVLVTGSFLWVPAADTDTVTFVLRDDTAGVSLTSKVIRAKDVDGIGLRGETVVLRRSYALPSTATRTFVLNITTAGGGADIFDIVLSVQGVT
jgi:hypothetical protein